MNENFKFLTLAMNECWHENGYYDKTRCINCGAESSNGCDIEEDQLCFSTWDGFGKAAEFAYKEIGVEATVKLMIDAQPVDKGYPARFADLLCNIILSQ